MLQISFSSFLSSSILTNVEKCDLDCGRNGHCQGGECVCLNGWSGSGCEDKLCDTRCHEHGECTNGTCTCKQGWNGKHCTLGKWSSSFFFKYLFTKSFHHQIVIWFLFMVPLFIWFYFKTFFLPSLMPNICTTAWARNCNIMIMFQDLKMILKKCVYLIISFKGCCECGKRVCLAF